MRVSGTVRRGRVEGCMGESEWGVMHGLILRVRMELESRPRMRLANQISIHFVSVKACVARYRSTHD